MLDMPLRVTITLGSEPTNVRAFAAGVRSGWRSFSTAAMLPSTFASCPPLTGSITRAGMPLLSRYLYRYSALVVPEEPPQPRDISFQST